jgi:hypothetical protein
MMKNYHEHSLLLKGEDVVRLEKAFELSWSRKTCFPANRDQWSITNKACGQCAVTVLVVNELYGGEIAYDKENDHYWNILPDGSQQDFSRMQSSDETIHKMTAIKERKDILDSKGALNAQTPQRYMLLRDKVMQTLKKLSG